MSVSDLKEYVKIQIKPNQIDDITRKGFVEIECDPITGDIISDNRTETVESKIEEMKEGVKEVINSEVDINLTGFDNQFKKLGQIGSQDVGKIVKVRGLINASGIIKPWFLEAVYICRQCLEPTRVIPQDPFKVTPPSICKTQTHGSKICGSFKFDLNTEESSYIDTRKISIQETPEDVSGQIPAWKNVLITKKSLLNKVKCGDYVYVIGIVKVRVKTGEESRFGETYIEANNIVVKRKELEVSELSKEDIEKILALSKEVNIYDKLIFNVAPSLYGLELEKESILLALVGGLNKNLGDITRRDCIHILLVGDPSVGKSQLLKSASNLAPSGIFSSGRGTSSAGLTAAVIKDEKDWVIAAGVMVLADKGIACIDEIDKMNPDDRDAMHTAMEQQTVDVHKANIHVSLNSRTTVIAAANPILGRYDQNKTIADNIKNLPVTLLSRFDIIFIIIDTVEKTRDELLVKHVIEGEEDHERIDRPLLKNYLIYAKQFNPILDEDAKAVIKKFYLESRTRQSPNDPIPITARQLESLVRLAQAHAKLFFKNKVDADDAKAAVRLLSESLHQTCKFQTSEADSSRVENPTSQKDKEKCMLDILTENHGELREDEWLEYCSKWSITKSEFMKYLIKLSDAGTIHETNFYPPTWTKV